MQALRPLPRCTESETLGWGPRKLGFNTLFSQLWCIQKFENLESKNYLEKWVFKERRILPSVFSWCLPAKSLNLDRNRKNSFPHGYPTATLLGFRGSHQLLKASWGSCHHPVPQLARPPRCQWACHRHPPLTSPQSPAGATGPRNHMTLRSPREPHRQATAHTDTQPTVAHTHTASCYTTRRSAFLLCHTPCHKHMHGTHCQAYIHILLLCSRHTHRHISHSTSSSQICLHIGLTCESVKVSVAQLCSTLCNSMDQGSNLSLLPCKQILYHLIYQGSPPRSLNSNGPGHTLHKLNKDL